MDLKLTTTTTKNIHISLRPDKTDNAKFETKFKMSGDMLALSTGYFVSL